MPPTDTDFGSIKDLTPGAAEAQVFDTVNRHRAEILTIRTGLHTEAERVTMLERMAETTRENIAELKRQEKVAWIPGGGASDLDARFMLPDGGVRLGRTKDQIRLRGLPDMEVVRPGLLVDERPVTVEHQRLVDAYRAWAIISTMRRGVVPWEGTDEIYRSASKAFIAAMGALPGRTGEFLRSMTRDPQVWERVMNGVAGTGGELISNPTVGMIRRPLLLQRRVAGLVRFEPVTNPTFKQPIITGHLLARNAGATTTDDPARFPVQRVTTSDASISVKKFNINVLVDPDWIRDAAAVLGDPIGFIVGAMNEGMNDTFEVVFLHGDTNNQDTLSTMTLGGYYTAGQLDGTDAPMKMMIGFRARAFDDSKSASGSGTFTAATHFAALSGLGNHAAGAVAITGLSCFYNSLLANSLFTSYNSMGPAGTLITGKLGTIGETPIIISEFMPKIFNTSSGLIDGSNLGHEITYVDPAAWVYYELTDSASDYDVTYQDKNARYLGMNSRGVLVANCISTETPCYNLYNI